jgi:eukaryotic-like serine/threonine-protein kinase
MSGFRSRRSLRGTQPRPRVALVRRVGGRHRCDNRFPVMRFRAPTGPPLQDDRAIEHDQTAVSRFAASELKAGERIANRYLIEALLGVGGMGVVYRARDEQLEIEIALKLLRPELASRPEAFERFRQELLLARKVSSPHVVRIHDLVADGQRWLISMDFVPGRSLEQYLDNRGPLSQDEALSIARQIALGLSTAHASGIVHRDLKPANVLLRDDGHACITDFGVARSMGAVRVTGTGMMVGTPDYLSPEQARGEAVDHRSDLYALGLILYEMLSGQRPFEDTTAAESLAQRQFSRPPRLRRVRPEVSPWTERLVLRLLDPNPLRRLRNADAVVAAIDAKRMPHAVPRARTFAAGAILLLAAAGGWWMQHRGLELSVAPSATTSSASASAPLPLDLVVLPLQADPADADLARAYTALINTTLLGSDGAVADRKQIENAVRRLGFDEAGAGQHPQRVLAELGARRALHGRLVRDDERLSIAFSLSSSDGGAPSEVSTAPVSVEALAPAIRGALAELKLNSADGDLGTVWPSSEDALRSFGKGLAASGGQAALDAFASAIQSEPRFVAAWWQRLLVGRRLLSEAAATAMAAQARETLRGVRGRDVERMQALIALVEGNATLAAERFAPLAAADPHDHHTRLLHAEALEAAGNRDAAIAVLEQITVDNSQNADAWLLRGQIAIRAGEAQRAVDDYLLRARVLFTRQRDEPGRANTLNALGLGFDLLGQSAPAIDYFNQAADLREAQGDARGAASSRRNLAWAHAVAGDTDAAEVDLRRARALAAPLADTGLLADIANDAGLIAEERGDFRAALPHFREALSLREAQGDALGVAEAALNLGFALLHTGRFADAQSHLESAERAYAAASDRTGTARSLQMLALIDMAIGDLPAAERRLQRALHLVEEVNLADERAVIHAEFAELKRLQGDRVAALEQAQRALALFQQQGDARGTTEAQLRIAAVHCDAGAWDLAEKILSSVSPEALRNREQAAAIALYRGEIAFGRTDGRTALKFAASALADAEAAHSAPMELRARLLRMRVLIADGELAGARGELPFVDRLLEAYPADELRRTRLRLVERMRPASPESRKIATTQGGARE